STRAPERVATAGPIRTRPGQSLAPADGGVDVPPVSIPGRGGTPSRRNRRVRRLQTHPHMSQGPLASTIVVAFAAVPAATGDSPWPAVRPASRRARVRRALWLVFTGLFVTLGSACGREGEFGAGRDESGPTIDEARDAVEGADDAGGDAASERAQPREIYYDLTRFDWYRRGEPLVADGR